MKQIPQALGVLRREIDHNPDDPGLYERLAVFLEQNKIGTEQEEVYRRAMARFPDRSWYHKLARYYLRYKKDGEFEKLTQEAVKQFDGSDLQNYFQSVVGAHTADVSAAEPICKRAVSAQSLFCPQPAARIPQR